MVEYFQFSMKIHEILGDWFDGKKRNLPWRSTSDPYKIWLSEIILQQTRVDQGIKYYNKFIQTFPDIFSLAQAETDVVMKLWQGLGYYSRARNLHETSKIIAVEYNGIFPCNYEDLIRLKGIGTYSAAAIASIAFQEPIAAIDGNVKRVLARLFLVNSELNSMKAKLKIKELADSILDHANPGRHNQAIMELGAIICLPRNPRCLKCPLSSICLALHENQIHEIPRQIKKKKVRKRFLTFIIITDTDNRVLFGRRERNDIWKHLYEFPLIETGRNPKIKDIQKIIFEGYQINYDAAKILRISKEITHILTHQRLICRFIHIKTQNHNLLHGTAYSWIRISDFHNFPIPKLIDRYISQNGIY